MNQITHLRVEGRPNPIGLDENSPRLTWRVEAYGPTKKLSGEKPTEFHVQVGTTPGGGELWSATTERGHITYGGTPLPPRTRIYWQVTARAGSDQPIESEVAWWETGIGPRSEWQGKWISGWLPGGPSTTVPAPYLRTEFKLAQPAQSARLYVACLGLYEAFINGKKVGDLELTPGWTDFRTRVPYQAFDVTDLLQSGENALGAILGDGWYAGHVGWRSRQYYGDQPQLLAELVIAHADGSVTKVVTDEKWSTGFGGILEADLLMGESFDARREPAGWASPGFSDPRWQPVTLAPEPASELVGQAHPPMRITQVVTPVDVRRLGGWEGSKWIFDFGQNLVGHLRIRAGSLKAGQTLVIRHAEVLDEHGSLYVDNLRKARCTDTYTASGAPDAVWEPKFTFHGFRYAEISGLTEEPPADLTAAAVIHSDLLQTGVFECSDPNLNRLFQNVQWGWRGNSLDVPTDCPQRDERLGWTGDAQVFAQTALLTTDAAPFFEKYMQDLADAQTASGSIPPVAPDVEIGLPDGGPGWADAFVIVPWEVYQATGDSRLLERHYSAMVRWLEQQHATSRAGVRSYPDYPDFKGFGDWLSTNAETTPDLIGTAFYAHACSLMSQIAELIGDAESQDRFEAWHQEAKTAFESNFLQKPEVLSQTGLTLALHFDLAPHASQTHLAALLVADIEKRGDHLSTGFLGTPYLLQVLSKFGHVNVAFRLLAQTTFPSWLYPVLNGATTIWERWDGWTDDKGFQDKGMNSFNHYAYGAVGTWLFEGILGFQQRAPGWSQVSLAPNIGAGLTSAQGSVDTPNGQLSSEWRVEGDAVTWRFSVPHGVEVTLGGFTEGCLSAEDRVLGRGAYLYVGPVQASQGRGKLTRV